MKYVLKWVMIGLIATVFQSAIGNQQSTTPNVILILADDLGWMDVTSYAARTRGVEPSDCFYETSNIDRLADQGMSFSQAYACPLCSPIT